MPLLAVTFATPEFGGILLVILLAYAGYVWVKRFAELMLLEDALFPGRYDKALWVAAFLVLWFVTPFAFKAWMAGRQYETASRAGRQRPAE